jgi:hypothetical protein
MIKIENVSKPIWLLTWVSDSQFLSKEEVKTPLCYAFPSYEKALDYVTFINETNSVVKAVVWEITGPLHVSSIKVTDDGRPS